LRIIIVGAKDNNMKINRDRHPKAKLPVDANIPVWRYMDKWKFEGLVKKKELYLCRGDLLQDKFEGTYSRAQLAEMNQWLTEKGYERQIEIEKQHRKMNRQRFYISSWCMSQYDLDLMWKAYTSDVDAIAIKSSISRLESVCDCAIEHWPLDISIVDYFGHAEGYMIDYFGDGFDAFVNKDYHFELDREIRLLHWRSYKPAQPEAVLLPVNLSTLIERVVLAPGATTADAEEIRRLLDYYGLSNAPVDSSRNDHEVM
jgi:hypothetical protein